MQPLPRDRELGASRGDELAPDRDLVIGQPLQHGPQPIVVQPGGVQAAKPVDPVLGGPSRHLIQGLGIQGHAIEDEHLGELAIGRRYGRLGREGGVDRRDHFQPAQHLLGEAASAHDVGLTFQYLGLDSHASPPGGSRFAEPGPNPPSGGAENKS